MTSSDLPKIEDLKQAMQWFKALSDAQKLYHRQYIARYDAISIARYWVAKIKK
jgi:hypothetical protein